MRRTRILATLGPASRGAEMIGGLLDAGSDAFRVNFSHGTVAEHRAVIRTVRRVARKRRREVAIVADLPGPKIRLGEIADGSVTLTEGADWTLDASGRTGDRKRVSLAEPRAIQAARPGESILVGDGTVELLVLRRFGGALLTRVVQGGSVSSRAGVYLPSARIRRASLGPKDLADLRIALEEGADFVALSFVRVASDLTYARARLNASGGQDVGLIAKIERAEALVHLDEILSACEGIMVARGDLGIEVPLERLALEQKRIVGLANAAHRPVIVATQMLLSMVHAPRPTRAEATDVANAVLDGADVVMLSEESAIGAHPTEAVQWLDRICRATERAAASGAVTIRLPEISPGEVDTQVALAAEELARTLKARAIVVPTHSGRTARLVASRRPATPVLALCASPATRRRLALTWGVEARACPTHLDLLALRSAAARIVAADSRFPGGGPIVVTAGYPVEGRPTNLLTVIERASNHPRTPPGAPEVRSRPSRTRRRTRLTRSGSRLP